MRVLIDGGCLDWGRTTGWERYTAAAVEAFARDSRGIDFDVLRGPAGGSRLRWEQEGLPRAIRGTGALLHCPAAPPSPLIRSPRITTVHDATLFYHPEWGSKAGRLLYRQLYLAQRGDRSAWQLTPSRASRADLQLTGFKGDRVHVASPPAGQLLEVEPEAPSADVGSRFVLFVGTLEPRKNVELLLAAWRAVPRGDARLVLAGRRGWNAPDTALPGVVEVGAVSDAELRWLYRRATAVVSPSRYEGFGFPVVEAMVEGTPVIATDIPASREVGGPQTTFVHPSDPADLAAALSATLADANGSGPPARSGTVANPYTLDRFGDELAAAYRAAAEEVQA